MKIKSEYGLFVVTVVWQTIFLTYYQINWPDLKSKKSETKKVEWIIYFE